MKAFVRIVAFVASLAILPTAFEAEAKTARVAAKLEGMEYLKARKVILGFGRTPVPGGCDGPDVSEKTCASYPEVRYCTGVGIGLCRMTFTRRDRCLLMLTVGGAPQDAAGDTTVREVTFAHGPCVNDPHS